MYTASRQVGQARIREVDGLDIRFHITTGFRKLLEAEAFNRITVVDICHEAGVSRKTFYEYFADKYAASAAIVFEDLIAPTLRLRTILPIDRLKSFPLLIFEQAYQHILDSRPVYENLYKGLGKARFVDLIVGEVEQFNLEDLAASAFPQDELEFVAHFIASNQAMILLWWIEHNMSIPPKRMAKLQTTWMFAHWREIADDSLPNFTASIAHKV